MAPITVMDNEMLGLQQEIGLRAMWECSDVDSKFLRLQNMDHKAVGGHLLVGKRISNPIAMNNYDHHQLNVATTTNTTSNTFQRQQLVNQDMLQQQQHHQHRRLDRTQSEPIRAQQQQQQLQPQQQPGSVSPTDRSSSSSRYKTELCRPFGETGFCKYGEKCQFAHGQNELRNMPRHPKYKTELCRTFHTTGLCGYGSRCHFIHNADERRNPSPTQSPHQTMSNPFDPLAPSPPASLSPSSQGGGSFFDESFKLSDEYCRPTFISLDTPPISPVESLAGDMDGLSLSPNVTTDSSPPPPTTMLMNAFKDNRFRLPIFEALTEVP